jgi:hypothetical protein
VINAAERVGQDRVERRERPAQQDHRTDHQTQERVRRERRPRRIDDYPEADGGDGVRDDGGDGTEAWLHRARGRDRRNRIGGSDRADGCEIGDVVDPARQVELDRRPVGHLDVVADGTDLNDQGRRQCHHADLLACVVGADVDEPPRDQLGGLFNLEQRNAQFAEHRSHFDVVVRIGVAERPRRLLAHRLPHSACSAALRFGHNR